MQSLMPIDNGDNRSENTPIRWREEGRYPRDDLNVRHTAPEAVALSGLSYGGTDGSILCTIPIPSRIGNSFVPPAPAYVLRLRNACATHIGTTALP